MCRHGLLTRRLRTFTRASGDFSGVTRKPSSVPVEEQRLPRYSQKTYYPVRIGEQLNDRYTIIVKLGFEAYSTVWLAKDQRTNAYTSVKIFATNTSSTSPVVNEVRILEHLRTCSKDHNASVIARMSDDMFQLHCSTGQHYCVVSKAQGYSLWTLRHMFPNGQLPKELVFNAIQRLLGCVNWFYLDCNLIHTGEARIATQNILTQIANQDHFEAVEKEEALNPSLPVAYDNQYPIYLSPGDPRNKLDLTGVPILTDFGSGRSADVVYEDWWMPDTYRAPEILMGVPWGFQVGIWSIGLMALELLQGRDLFEPIDRIHMQYVLPLALAQYIFVLGPPPLWMIQESANPLIPTFFDDQGRWISQLPIPEFSLHKWVAAIPSGKEKDKFIDFMSKILVWGAMERGTSYDMYAHELLAKHQS